MYRGSIYGSFDNKSYAGQLLVKSVIALLVLLNSQENSAGDEVFITCG